MADVVVLLHGLAGHAGEWDETASWLAARARVVALDDARVEDVVEAIEGMGEGPVVLVGQSLGGVTALLVAADHPDLVRALVLIEASPAGADDDAAARAAADAFVERLASWPVPFASREAALAFFAQRTGSSLAARAWTDGLEERDGALWPAFDPDELCRRLYEATRRSYWEQWDRIECPVLLVRAPEGAVPDALAATMAERNPRLRVAVVDARHDIHLDAPAAWRRCLEEFLDEI